jgi:hypothetical protein
MLLVLRRNRQKRDHGGVTEHLPIHIKLRDEGKHLWHYGVANTT